MRPWDLLSCIVLPSVSLEGQMTDDPRITNLLTLQQELPGICQNLFDELGSQQLERTYQQCLAIDLLQAGVDEVHVEAKLPLRYKGQVVGNRRADMVLDLSSGERAILELKAVEKMGLLHRVQLEYYMYYATIDEGYLINFPHDDSFPSVADKAEFEYQDLTGGNTQHLLNNRSNLYLRNTPNDREVEVVHIRRNRELAEEPGTIVPGSLIVDQVGVGNESEDKVDAFTQLLEKASEDEIAGFVQWLGRLKL